MTNDSSASHRSAEFSVAERPPVESDCPAGVADGARCLRGQDSAGAHYLIVIPAQWSGVLVVHAHGGPPLGEPKATRADEDIKRWSVIVRQRHAWAASVFRDSGFAVRSAVEDTERVRRIFVEHVAKPKRTLLHGQSWGAMVAAKAAERYPESWDGLLLTSGAVGGPLAYDFRLDLRVIYQYLCNNHPAPDEPAYPLCDGLPQNSVLTEQALAARANACLAIDLPPARRSAEQTRKLKTIVDVLKIPEDAIIDQLRWATWTLRSVVENHGGSPVGNDRARYVGSGDDAALNAAVLRYRAEPSARARFARDSDYSGRFTMPVLTVHGIRDATCVVEVHDTLRRRMREAGCEHLLLQTFVDSDQHSYLGDAIYPPLLEALLRWIESATKPIPDEIAARCRTMTGLPSPSCGFVPDYVPGPLCARVHPR